MSQPDIIRSLGLGPEVQQSAEALIALVYQFEGLEFPLSLEPPILPSLEVSHFLFYEGEKLLGLAGLQEFAEVELYLLVHPEARRRGIGRALLNEVKAECRRHDHAHLLLVCDERSRPGKAFANAAGAQHQSAEYHMELDPLAIDRSRPRPEGFQLRPAGAEDIDLLAELQAAAFGDPEEETKVHVAQGLQDPTRQYLIGWLGREPVGLLRLGRYDKMADITAFGVIPAYRGRGYGRQMLLDAIDRLLAETWPQICIDVATDNENALGLYQSCGFKVTQTYGFYFLLL